jgi:hypothetical protein
MGRRGSWQFAQKERERLESKRMNPVWRGVGCLMVIVIGVLGYAFAGWFIRQGFIYLPLEVINPPEPFPAFLRGGNLVRYVVALLFMLTGFGVVNFVYAVLFPVKPGEFDLPTPKRQRRKRR